jgi:2-polyprenyl-3-methyl-5-hydroxy-6-metoxy-1,4-benzoquinol methylase
MPDFSQRALDVEIMDDLNCSGEVVHQTLRELEFINAWLGGNAVTLSGLDTLISDQHTTLTIADLGCGSGDVLRIIARRFFKNKLQLTGIDANPHIIAFARKNTHDAPLINYQTLNILFDEFRKQQYDVITATLFLHHFTTKQLVEIFSNLRKQAIVGIVVNDLHRHWLAYHAIKILTRLFSKSAMVKYDAPLSVLRGFTRGELADILKKAGIVQYTLKWKWAFRWQIIIRS